MDPAVSSLSVSGKEKVERLTEISKHCCGYQTAACFSSRFEAYCHGKPRRIDRKHVSTASEEHQHVSSMSHHHRLLFL